MENLGLDESVLSLPIRNWNSDTYITQIAGILSFEPTYKELKPTCP